MEQPAAVLLQSRCSPEHRNIMLQARVGNRTRFHARWPDDFWLLIMNCRDNKQGDTMFGVGCFHGASTRTARV